MLATGLIGLTDSLAFHSSSLEEIGTFNFALRTGGSLFAPSIPEVEYPLTHTMYDPGNTSLEYIPVFRHFSVYFQFLCGLSILDNGSQDMDANPIPEDARYNISMDLNTTLQVASDVNTTEFDIDRLRSIHLNESMAEQIIITRPIEVIYDTYSSTIELDYYSSQYNQSSHEIIIQQVSFNASLVEILNMSIISHWIFRFTSLGGSDILLSGNGIVGQFQIAKNTNTTTSIEGNFRSYFDGKQVMVLLPRSLLIPESLIVSSGTLFALALLLKRRSIHSTRSSTLGSISS